MSITFIERELQTKCPNRSSWFLKAAFDNETWEHQRKFSSVTASTPLYTAVVFYKDTLSDTRNFTCMCVNACALFSMMTVRESCDAGCRFSMIHMVTHTVEIESIQAVEPPQR